MKRALTDTAVKNAKRDVRPYQLRDGGGLFLFVNTTGARSWRYKYRIGGREGRYTIGMYPDVSLKDARTEHERARVLVRDGVRPLDHRRSEITEKVEDSKNTFRAVAEEWIEKNRGRWSGSYLKQVERAMGQYVFPQFGALPVKKVKPAHILATMKKAEAGNAKTVALLIRQWCSQIFRYAVANGKAEVDPTATLRGAVVREKVRHHGHLEEKEIAAFKTKLAQFGGYRATAIAIELLLLTFVRTKELRMAEWSEFDLEKRIWTIPAGRMKMREAHVVPLSMQAVALLEELRTWTGGRPFLFPNNRRPSVCMSATTINRALERMGYTGKLSAHGFRGTASTVLHALGKPSHIIERQMAHKERNKVKAAYNHAEYLAERGSLMQFWANHLDHLCSHKVVNHAVFTKAA